MSAAVAGYQHELFTWRTSPGVGLGLPGALWAAGERKAAPPDTRVAFGTGCIHCCPSSHLVLSPQALAFLIFLIYVYISYHIKQVRRFKNSNLFITGLLGKTCSEWFAGSCLPWCWPREAHGSSANGLTLLLLFPSSSTSLYILMVYICYWTDCTRWT